ncbi:hypothetical protein [Salinicoccus bachuensis]|uniref:Uncharacterized protein n=1 Tax=Salinicoccus bachuensis TaxID=3136731 RepID=A0ABZ3CHS1_9STAP
MNATSILVGFVWIIVSYILLHTIFLDWTQSMPTVLPVILIAGGTVAIKLIFDCIMKYDYFNKDYKKDEK